MSADSDGDAPRLEIIGTPLNYHTSLGRFIDVFASVEIALFLLLTRTAGVPLTTAQAIFSDARIERAKDTVNRIRRAHGLPPDELLARAFHQLGQIARIRNNLCHYGVMRDAQTNELKVSNVLVAMPDKVQSDPISAEILEDMIWDLQTIKQAMNAMWFTSPATPPQVVAMIRGNASQPWRYKPLVQAPQEKSTRGKRRERKHRQQSSQA